MQGPDYNSMNDALCDTISEVETLPCHFYSKVFISRRLQQESTLFCGSRKELKSVQRALSDCESTMTPI